jgi:UDP-glucose 4-epimerase
MRILLTGGAGYIGSHAAIALSMAGHEVIILDNFSNSQKSVIGQIEEIAKTNISCVEGDVRDTLLLVRLLQNEGVEGVIHFAGLKAVGESTNEPLIYFANNVGGTISLLEAMSLVNIKKLVFSSSATVYGIPKYLPIDENHPVGSTNPYGRSKLYVEGILEDIVFSDKNWRIACLRYFNPVGAHESGLIGEDSGAIPNNLMPFISQVAAGKLPCLRIYGDDYLTPDGTGVRDYIHVMDLAEAHLSALNFLDKFVGLTKVNIGTGRGFSVLELIRVFERATETRVPFEITSRRHGDVAACFAGIEKATHDLQWAASRSIEEMCISALNWERSKSEVNK